MLCLYCGFVMVHYILAQESKFVPREERGAGLQGKQSIASAAYDLAACTSLKGCYSLAWPKQTATYD